MIVCYQLKVSDYEKNTTSYVWLTPIRTPGNGQPYMLGKFDIKTMQSRPFQYYFPICAWKIKQLKTS